MSWTITALVAQIGFLCNLAHPTSRDKYHHTIGFCHRFPPTILTKNQTQRLWSEIGSYLLLSSFRNNRMRWPPSNLSQPPFFKTNLDFSKIILCPKLNHIEQSLIHSHQFRSKQSILIQLSPQPWLRQIMPKFKMERSTSLRNLPIPNN